MDNHADEDRQKLLKQLEQIVSKEHWLGDLIKDLAGAYALSNDISFDQAESMFDQTKLAFEMDLKTARRMYRLYPKLVSEIQQPNQPTTTEPETKTDYLS